jgi:hypothetical protein
MIPASKTNLRSTRARPGVEHATFALVLFGQQAAHETSAKFFTFSVPTFFLRFLRFFFGFNAFRLLLIFLRGLVLLPRMLMAARMISCSSFIILS